MDSYLTGREDLGDDSQKKDKLALAPQAVLQKLHAADGDGDSELHEAHGEGGSKIAYLSENGRIAKIVVTCACGQVTEIDCAYKE